MSKTTLIEDDYINFCQVTNNYYVVTDGTDKFCRFSPNLPILLEYTDEEFQEISFFNLIHPDDIAKTLSAFTRLSSPNSTIENLAGLLNRYITRTGRIVWLYWSARSIGNGIVYSVATEVTDLLTQKAARAQFKTKEEVIEELTSKEMEIFSKLLTQDGRSVSKKSLSEALYKDTKVQEHTINVHISNLRKKIKGSAYLVKSVGKGRWKIIDKTKPIPIQDI